MTGEELAAIRKAARLSQTELAERVGIGRHAVSYWECRAKVDRRAWAVCAIGKVLTLPDEVAFYRPRRVWADRLQAMREAEEAAIRAHMARIQAGIDAAAAKRRLRCGAKTRKGTPCRCKSEPGKRRCKFHGGMSTGAKTAEGRERIREAQRLRWARWRAMKGGGRSLGRPSSGTGMGRQILASTK